MTSQTEWDMWSCWVCSWNVIKVSLSTV